MADDDARRLSWESRLHTAATGGVLTVAEDAAGSPVTIEVTIPEAPAEADEEITRGLRETLDRIGGLTQT